MKAEAAREMTYDVYQEGMKVASVTGRGREAFSAALHYAFVYGQDGPICTIRSRAARRSGKKKPKTHSRRSHERRHER